MGSLQLGVQIECQAFSRRLVLALVVKGKRPYQFNHRSGILACEEWAKARHTVPHPGAGGSRETRVFAGLWSLTAQVLNDKDRCTDKNDGNAHIHVDIVGIGNDPAGEQCYR